MRKSKEERVIDHSAEILDELHRIYKEGIGIDEYLKLLNEYKKLFKRYERTIKLSDSMGKGILDENDILNENLQYTIKTARNKLLENVSEHRKTKEMSSKYKNALKEYEDALKNSYKESSDLEKKLNYYIKEYGEIEHSFYNSVKTQNDNVLTNLTSDKYKNMNISSIVSSELVNNKENFILAKIALNNFESMIPSIEKSSSVQNFIFGIYKYIKNIFSEEVIIIHAGTESFYLIFNNKNLTSLKELFLKLNRKRTILNFPIKFAVGCTQFALNSDNTDTFIRRCENAFLLSLEKNEVIIK